MVGLDPSKIYVSCFIGNKKYNIPRDDESAKIWQKVFAEKGIDAKIVELDTAENGDKLGLQGGRIFFYNVKRTGGAEVVDWILHQLGIRVVQTLKYFMILVKKTTTLALEKLILQVIAVDLWRSVTRCLCSIAVSRMALSNLLSTRMLIFGGGLERIRRGQKLTTRMFSKLA